MVLLLMFILMLFGIGAGILPQASAVPLCVMGAFVIPITHTLCRKVKSLTTRITELELALQQNKPAQ